MPANLTPMYHKAEREYRRAQSLEEQIRCLESMLQLIPKHKGTDRLQGDLRRRLKETREELLRERSALRSGAANFRFARQGAGTIVVIGGPNSGKSRIVAELTNCETQVADYPYATREPLAAIMEWKDVRLQLIDTPPITASSLDPWLLNLIRTADAAVLALSGASDDGPDDAIAVVRELERRKTRLADCSGFDEQNFAVVNVKTLVTVTQCRAPDVDVRLKLFRELAPIALPQIAVDLDESNAIEELRTSIFGLLQVIRCYTKRPGEPAEKADPFTLPAGSTVSDLAFKVHRDQAEQLRSEKVWTGEDTTGQTVGGGHPLRDQDVVELRW